MEEWQIEHITQNLTQLTDLTIFNCPLKTELFANKILCKADVEKLDVVQRQEGDLEASRHGYQVLLKRRGAYRVLYKALVETNQSGAYTILIRVPNDLFSKPLTYLGISTELKTFRDMPIEVQGKKIKINEFFPSIDYKSLQQIFRNCLSELEIYDTFVTGERSFELVSNTLPAKPPYYVPRFISNRIKIDEAIFKADFADVFVFKKSLARYELYQIAKPHFTDTSISQLTNITSRFIYLDEDEDWPELKKSAKVPIHLINYVAKQDIYLLEDSSAPSDILKKLGSKEARVYMSEEEFVQQQLSENCKSSSVCICDTPGMGKTFLLANIASLMAFKCAGRIVVFIQLTSFTHNFFQDSTNEMLDPETSIMNVLSYTCPRPQNQALLLTLIKTEILRLEIFFDGFDEITTDKVDWTKQVFRSITTTFPKTRINITSRPHMRQELEESLGVVAYDILPFNHKNQIDFLVQYWQQSKPDSGYRSLQSYATSCLEAVNKSLTKNDKEIAGIPLLCQLIAEVYSDKVSKNWSKRKFCDVQLKISGMYHDFIEKKINLVALKTNFKLHELLKLAHIWHALKLISPTNNFHEDKKFKTVKGLLTSPKMIRAGILQKHSNGALEFIHRTFAEYLVADYFIAKLMENQKFEEMNSDSITILKLLLTDTGSLRIVHPVIVSFFDAALIKYLSSEQLKMQAAAFVSSISPEKFIGILRACGQHSFVNLFCLLTQAVAKWDNSRILECFTHKKCNNLLKFNIFNILSTSQLFQKCIHFLTEELKLDLEHINTFDKHNTVLQHAVKYANYEAVEYFVDRISIKNQSLLQICVEYSYEKDDIEKRVNILNLLLNKDPTLISETPHILLARLIDVRLFKILVKFGASLNATNEYRFNCAMNIAPRIYPTDYHELVQFLLTDCKADYLFLENEKWQDPLPMIIRTAILLPETLELLLSIPGNDISMKNEIGEGFLFPAANGNKLDNFQQLLNLGLDYNERGNENRSLLHGAAINGRLEMVHYLLSLKLDPNSRDQIEWTPLHHAALQNNPSLSVLEALVGNGANIEAKTIEGFTALHIFAAVNNPKEEIIKYLIGKGLAINDCDNAGNTPLHFCRKKEAKDCLVEMGADVHAKNKRGQTPAQRNPDLWK